MTSTEMGQIINDITFRVVWVNGNCLGRFWNIGPQGTLYLPAPWLKKGQNEIVVFDLNGQANPTVPFLAHAVLDKAGK